MLLAAAGGAAEPFWAQWPAHWDRADRESGSAAPRPSARVEEALAPYRVGMLRDPLGDEETRAIVREAYAAEPQRCTLPDDAASSSGDKNALVVVTRWPFQAEPKYFGCGSHSHHQRIAKQLNGMCLSNMQMYCVVRPFRRISKFPLSHKGGQQ